MPKAIHSRSITREQFFKPLFEVFSSSRCRRDCSAIPDELWLECGVRRCLDVFRSGRDFLQHLADRHQVDILVQTFFESLKSQRRLGLLTDVLLRQQSVMAKAMPDPLATFKCLQDFEIFAGDGHFIAAACHDKKKPDKAPKSPGEQSGPEQRTAEIKYATGHLYTLNLRTHAMTHLCVADQIERKKEHEMRALKRLEIDMLRQHAPKGRKVLYIWDKAAIDFRKWYEWKQNGIYFLSREKDNMQLEVIGQYPVDLSDPINEGILSDEETATSQGVSIRRVVFRDPETGILYRFITNLPKSIPPGVVALLYKLRWDIEKVFDEFKNKLEETKAWASTATAKTIQARLLCLTHNLLTMLEQEIERNTGIANMAEEKRRAERTAARDAAQKKTSGKELPLIHRVVQRFSQRTVKFIRWLNNHFDSEAPWPQVLARLRAIYTAS